MSDAGDRLLSGNAWHDFCDRLKSVGDTIIGEGFPTDPHDRAEGVRYLTRLLSYAVRAEVECGDPDFPSFCRYEEPHNQWGGPNPDNTYLRAQVNPKHSYRVWGNLKGMRQAIFSLQEGDMQLKQYGVFSEQSVDDMHIEEDGSWELWIGEEQQPGQRNFMKMTPDSHIFQVRIYLSDWEKDASPALHIERLGAPATPPLVTPEAVASGLDKAIHWVEASASYWNQYTSAAWSRATPNVAGAPGSTPGGADNIKYGSCFWELEEDQALILTSEQPQAQYWNFCIHTLGWLESADFANRQVSLTGHQVHIDDDDLVRVVLARRDPGVPNWIDIEGRPRGLLVYRWVWATNNPCPEAQVVPLDQVRQHLPDSHPSVDAAGRHAQLRRRRELFWERYL